MYSNSPSKFKAKTPEGTSTEWAKSKYTVIFFFTGIVNDGRELKYRTKKVDVKQLKLNVKLTNVNI